MSNFTVYRASAGSGKTFSLVIEYLSIALKDGSGKNYRKILGVTFTNKAAGELKERILKFLKGVSVKSDHKNYNKTVSEILCKRLGVSEQELARRAQLTLSDILHNYSRLSISTIDKFVLRLIRSFARELKLQGDFEIEMDAERAYQKVAQRVINLIGKEEQLTDWIIKWLIGRLEENSGTGDYESSLVNFMKNISSDEAAPHKERLIQLKPEDLIVIREKLKSITVDFESTAFAIGQQGWDMIIAAGLTIDDFSYTTSGPGAYFKRLSDKKTDALEIKVRVHGMFEKGKLFSGKSSAGVEEVTPALTEIYYQLVNLINSNISNYKLASLLRKEFYVLGLASKMEELLKTYLDEKNLVLISDFNKKIAEVVINEPAPFIYELLGERFDHFLIDEFQDTSILQWHNFLPLVDNSLGKGGKTLIVGDGKQSIYRFRGGEVEQFQKLPDIFNGADTPIFKQYQAALKRNHLNIPIEDNFRSTRNVVNFNNRFIDSLSGYLSERYFPVFSDGKQNPTLTEDGYVFVKTIEKDPEEEDSIDQLHLNQLVQDVKRLKEAGYPYRDTCVLVMKNDHGTLVAQELLAEGIPVISEESLNVLYSQKARFLLGCMQLLNDSQSGFGQLNTIENAVFLGKLNGDALSLFQKYCYKLGNGQRGLNCKVRELFRDLGIAESIEQLKAKDLYSMAESLARTFGFMETYDPFVQFFLDQTLSCLMKEGNHLSDCVNWWEENGKKAKVVLPEGLDAVKIMTVHKSKGLEFENVIFPFVHWRAQSTKKILWIEPGEIFTPLTSALVPNSEKALKQTGFEHLNTLETEKDQLDEANKIYVALTRAAKNLFVYSGKMRTTNELCLFFNNWIKSQDDYSADKACLEIGELKIKSSQGDQKPDKAILTLEKLISNYDESKLIIGYQAPKFWNTDDTSTDKDRGNLIHTLMTDIHSEADIDQALEKFNRSGVLQENELDEVYKALQKIVFLGQKQGWMGSELRAMNEMDLLNTESAKPEIIRPDRVVFGADYTWVIDYKTGSQLESHQQQVKNYIRALQAMNFPNVKGSLVYLETASTIELT